MDRPKHRRSNGVELDFRLVVKILIFAVFSTVILLQLGTIVQLLQVDDHSVVDRYVHSSRQQQPIAATKHQRKNPSDIKVGQQDGTIESRNTTTMSPLEKILQNVYGQYDKKKLNEMPSWNEIASLYGSNAKILGLDSCEKFRKVVPQARRSIGVAGTFNSGTNLLSSLLSSNCMIEGQNQPVHWQVPWGKHTPASYRGNHIAKSPDGRIPIDTELVVVVTRDPYTWMQSMCVKNYNAHWDRRPKEETGECPNLVPTEKNKQDYPVKYQTLKHVAVTVDYDRKANPKRIERHASLAHFYNEWHHGYMNATTFPRLIVRLEDLVFRGEEIIASICQCAGGTLKYEKFVQKRSSAKIDKNTAKGTEQTGLLGAIVKYGNASNRRIGFASNQLYAAKELLDPRLMTTFGYKFEDPWR